jgi:hypothetical protein
MKRFQPASVSRAAPYATWATRGKDYPRPDSIYLCASWFSTARSQQCLIR